MTPQKFTESIQEGVVLVDFFSESCGPCRSLAPILDQLENVTVLKVDVYDSPEVSNEYNISAVPTLKFFKNGQLHDTLMGLQSKDKLQNKIDSLNDDC